LLSFVSESLILLCAIKKCKDENVQNYNFSCCFICVCRGKGRIYIEEGDWELGVEETVRTQESGSYSSMEEVT